MKEVWQQLAFEVVFPCFLQKAHKYISLKSFSSKWSEAYKDSQKCLPLTLCFLIVFSVANVFAVVKLFAVRSFIFLEEEHLNLFGYFGINYSALYWLTEDKNIQAKCYFIKRNKLILEKQNLKFNHILSSFCRQL